LLPLTEHGQGALASFLEEFHTFLLKVDFNKSIVKVGLTRVFLCGGARSAPNAPPTNLREFILRKILKDNPSEIVLAEEIFSAQIDPNIYEDLLTFEKNICSFCSSILLILESPGSIAELGSFCVIPETKQKLTILIQQTHNEQNSYIKNGPLRHINQDNILSYQWDSYSEADPSLLERSAQQIWAPLHDEINELLIEKSEKTPFDYKNQFHICILISSLSAISFPLTKKDIQTLFSKVFPGLKSKDLDLALWLGTHFKILKKIDVKNTYYSNAIPRDHFEFIATPGNYLDIDRMTAISSQFIKSQQQIDRKRYSALLKSNESVS
jgi:hypothetical protein